MVNNTITNVLSSVASIFIPTYNDTSIPIEDSKKTNTNGEHSTTDEEIDDFSKQIEELTRETTRSLDASDPKTEEEVEEYNDQINTINIIQTQLSSLKKADKRSEKLEYPPQPKIPSQSELYQQFKKDVQEAQEEEGQQ